MCFFIKILMGVCVCVYYPLRSIKTFLPDHKLFPDLSALLS